MSLDAFSVVLAFLAAVEVVLGCAALVLGIREARAPGTASTEGRRPLLALVAAATVAIAVLSFPLHYLLLASWVPRWPGIMCVEGVRRIGTGTVGAARFLPGLVTALDGTRLAVIFTAGAWLLLRRVPGSRAAALMAVLFGCTAILDGAAAFTYVVLPKQEILPTAGCCSVPSSVADMGAGAPAGLGPAYIGATALLGAAALWMRGRRGRGILALLAAGSLPLASRFLADLAAPSVLGLPFHHCAWCAFAGAPETVVGAVLHIGAVLCAGWAPFAGERGDRLLGAAGFGFLAASAMGTVLVLLP